MNNFQLWGQVVHPSNSKFFADYFWMKLQPDWMNNRNTSPWAKHETRKDWSIDELGSALAGIGLDFVAGGGYCPVQVEANLSDGRELYFRARGEGWYCEIEESDLYHDGNYGSEPFAAGYMPFSEAFDRIKESLKKWEILAA